ncbi:MAG: dUTP diphosphatase [Candidatus Omnitrophota bacterium]|nr:dUTP diphosphatase [Candidatus Omnitrophota bacterium]
MASIKVEISKEENAKDLPIPHYATNGSSGMDLYADVKNELTVKPGDIRLISTGIYLSIPPCYEAEIRPRSGLALKHGITLVNSPGTIDSDYRGMVSVIITNLGKEPYVIKRGDRIAQMMFKETVKAHLEIREELDETERASGGFGHTGVSLSCKERR